MEKLIGKSRNRWISNEATLYDIYVCQHLGDLKSPPDVEEIRNYWLSKIEKIYGIDLSDLDDDELNIARVGSELERRLEWEKLGNEQ